MAEYTYEQMQEAFYNGMRLMHYPVAVKFIFKDEELEEFKKNVKEYYTPVKKLTFCQWEIAARMEGHTVLAERDDMGCANAQFCFGWKPMDEKEIKGHAKYTRDLEQAERFVKSKSRLPEDELKAVVVSPLADTYFEPDVVHFYCDNMQAYHLSLFWMSAMDVHPLRPNVTMNSSACGGNVYTFVEQAANMVPACSGSYNAGKTERGEVNFMIPGKHLQQVMARMEDHREKHGSYTITRTGNNFPGADICKNCPLIVFKKNVSE